MAVKVHYCELKGNFSPFDRGFFSKREFFNFFSQFSQIGSMEFQRKTTVSIMLIMVYISLP